MAVKNVISIATPPVSAEAAHAMPDRLSLHLGFVLNRAAQQMRETFETALEPLAIKPRHYGVMSIIAEAGPLPQHVIGEKLNCDRNMMVAIVDDLEKSGLARRDVHPSDRRAYAVNLTPAGRKLLEKARAIASSVENGFLAPLTAKQQRQLHQLLKLLTCREVSE
jgi:MarR family transcriptional regulator, lower aerobic nicotinate degradation pathway regulator